MKNFMAPSYSVRDNYMGKEREKLLLWGCLEDNNLGKENEEKMLLRNMGLSFPFARNFEA